MTPEKLTSTARHPRWRAMSFSRRRFLTLGLPALGGAPLLAAPASMPVVSAPQLRFGVIADPQYVDAPPAGTRHYRESLGKLEACVAEMNRHDLAFVITLGDLIDRDFASFGPVLGKYSALKSSHRIVLGNHDFAVADADKPRVLGNVGLPSAHYSFSHGPWRIVVIDGTEVSTYRHATDDPRTADAGQRLAKLASTGAGNAKEWNGAVGDAQLQWLDGELSAAKTAAQRVIVCGHFPLLPLGDSHRLWNSGEVVALLDRHPHVAAYFNGHNHKGNHTHAAHCHHVNFKGMVETATDNPFAIVECHADRLDITGYGPEPTRGKLG